MEYHGIWTYDSPHLHGEKPGGATDGESQSITESWQDLEMIVMAIGDLYQTGKSYLMNCLAGEKNG